jgi:hypothetical protein
MRPRNLCRACGKDFTSVTGFDAHRVGKHGYTHSEGLKMDPAREDGRCCLLDVELAGLGYEQDADGRWFNPAVRDDVRRRLG